MSTIYYKKVKNFINYATRFALRDNKIIEKKIKNFTSFPLLNRDEHSILQQKLVNKALTCAVNTIPFYKGFDIGNAAAKKGLEVLKRFPVISKSDLLDKKLDFYPALAKKKLWWSLGKTSGTTGSPLELFRSYNSVLYENAFIRRHWSWSGFNRGMRRATLRGDVVVPIEKKSPPFWYYNPFDKQLLISSRHLQKESLPAIAEKLKNFQPYILEAYPSTVHELAKFLEDENRFIEVPYVFTGSEMLYGHQRTLIEERLRCKVMDFYGMAERVAFASECEFGNLHLNTDYSFVEILDENNNPTDDYGYITGTTFHNLAMPLVRYKLSDITKWKKGECACGRTFPMIEPIQGKFEDMLYGGEGAPVSPSVLTFAFKGLSNINQSQVAQVDQYLWEIRIIPGFNYTQEENTKLIKNIAELVDPTITVNVKIVKEIPRTAAGKYSWVVNEWKQQNKTVPNRQ